MRIAVGGLHTESSTYNPVLTERGDFRQLRGATLLSDPYFRWLAEYDAMFLPILHARALPGGPVTANAYVAFKAEFLEALQALVPLDGVYLAMHGAMFVEGMQDCEGDFITAVREVAGDACMIAVSYDLHGNVSQPIIDAIDIFVGYRTAPHIDVEETMRRAVAMLLRSLTTGQRPVVAFAPVPVLLPGERTSTEDEPARSFYARLPAYDGGAVWDTSFQVGYVWADEPRATAAAIVTGTDRAATAGVAAALAQGYWDLRRDFVFGMPTMPVADAIVRALASATHPVILADSGDNPTGGGVGDRADLLAALLAVSAPDAVIAGIADRPACDAAYAAGVGAALRLTLGATLDPQSKPVEVDAVVGFLLPTDDMAERQAVLTISGIRLVVTARRRPFHNISDFAQLGLDPREHALVVVKSGYLSPELAPIANPGLMALSAGVVDQDIPRIASQLRQRPCFPFDDGFDWLPEVSFSKPR